MTQQTKILPAVFKPPETGFYYLLHGYPTSSNLELIHQQRIEQAAGQITVHCANAVIPELQLSETTVSAGHAGAEVCIPDIGIFQLSSSAITGEVCPGAFVAPFIQGRLIALVLELGVHTVLHGATLCTEQHSCFGILGPSGCGKSTLSAYLLGKGFQLLTDDLIPVKQAEPQTIVASSSHLRMWKDSAIAVGKNIGELEQVHPAVEKYWVPAPHKVAAGESRQLSALFVLDRRYDGCDFAIRQLAPAQALTEVHAQGYRPEVIDALGLTRRRMKILSALLEKIPVYLLTYPNGLEHMDRITALIEEKVSQK